MLKGQLSVSFILQVGLGFFLMTAIAYSTISLDETMKKESQRQTLISVSEYVATQLLGMMQYLPEGGSTNQTMRLPMSRDSYSGQYSVELEDIDGVAYVAVQSAKWPDMIARQPLFLNTSRLEIDSTKLFPPGFCPKISRNHTHYKLSITC